MTDIHLSTEFTTDEREGGTVSIALVLSAEPEELWKRSFNDWIDDRAWLGENDGVILGHTFPFSYDDTHKIELRTHVETVENALDAVAKTIAKVNEERAAAALEHSKAFDDTTAVHAKVQGWFDEQRVTTTA